MINQPLISILLCTYNGAEFLQEQLDSIDAQTYKNLEVICSDNGSIDGSYHILERWCKVDSHKQLTKQESPGLNKNFYNALQFATGEFIMFCDQDDVWLPSKVEKLVTFILNNKQTSMCYALSQQFNGNTPTQIAVMKPAPRLEGRNFKKTLLNSFTLGHNMIISRQFLKKIPIPETEVVAYDWWITVGAMCLGEIKCNEEVLTFWRQHPHNTTKVLNEPFFYQSRQEYLKTFLQLSLIPTDTKKWISEAIQHFERLNHKKFSTQLFLFLMKYADQLFFYKLKKGPQKWISFGKLAFKMSNANFKP